MYDVVETVDFYGRLVWRCPVCGASELADDTFGEQRDVPFEVVSDATWLCKYCGAMLSAP